VDHRALSVIGRNDFVNRFFFRKNCRRLDANEECLIFDFQLLIDLNGVQISAFCNIAFHDITDNITGNLRILHDEQFFAVSGDDARIFNLGTVSIDCIRFYKHVECIRPCYSECQRYQKCDIHFFICSYILQHKNNLPICYLVSICNSAVI